MATISLIQGTDSLSASRVTLNDNFTALNDELGLVTGLLDPTTSTLSNMTSVSTNVLDITGAASFASTGNTLAVDTDVDGLLKINKGAAYDAETVVNMPTGSYESSSYIVNGTSVTLNAAAEGQEITIIGNVAALPGVSVDTALIAGVGQLQLPQYATATLRYHGGAWYLIAASPLATVA